MHSCHQCRDAVEREGWVKTRLASLQFAGPSAAPSHLKGSLLVRGWPPAGPTAATPTWSCAAATAGRAATSAWPASAAVPSGPP